MYRTYLRGREDTVHCMVTSLTEEGATDLSDELAGCKKITLCDVVATVEDDMENWENWVPDPIEVVPGNFILIYEIIHVIEIFQIIASYFYRYQ